MITTIPDYVRYIAQNKNGELVGFSTVPVPNEEVGKWILGMYDSNERSVIIMKLAENKNWKSTLMFHAHKRILLGG